MTIILSTLLAGSALLDEISIRVHVWLIKCCPPCCIWKGSCKISSEKSWQGMAKGLLILSPCALLISIEKRREEI